MASIAELTNNPVAPSPEDQEGTPKPQSTTPTHFGSKRPFPRGTAAYPRKRAVTACQVCRARRTKCDNRKPSCSFCLKVGTPCVQSSTDLSSFDPASLKILERLDELESALGQYHTTISASRVNSGEAGQPSPHIPSERAAADIDRASILPQSIEAIRTWEVLELQNTSDIDLVEALEGCVFTPLSERTSLVSDSLIDEMQPQLTKMLVLNFFQYVHVKNPILDETQTHRLVSRLSMDGIDWSPESCLALLVLALGATASPFQHNELGGKDPETIQYASGFYKAAQKRLGMVIGSGTLVEAQCLFLCGVYMMTSFQRHVAWKFFIQTLACCQSFKFLRDLSTGKGRLSAFPQGNDYPTYDTQTQQSLQAEQAIYWSAWKSERELREDIQAPDFAPSKTELAIYPPFFPTPPLLQDRSATRTGLVGLEYRQQISWYFYLSEISLRRLLSRITNQIVQFRPSGVPLLEGLAQMTVVHEAQAEEWALALPQILSLDCHPEEDEICRFVLRGHLINLYELIYWPFVYAAVNNADFDSEKQPAPQSSVLIRSLCRKGLQKHVERLWVNRPGFKHRHHGTPALLRSCSRSALVLVAAAASIQTRLRQGLSSSFTMPHGWRQAVLWAVEMNEFWEGESTDSQYLAGLLKVAWGKVEPSNL